MGVNASLADAFKGISAVGAVWLGRRCRRVLSLWETKRPPRVRLYMSRKRGQGALTSDRVGEHELARGGRSLLRSTGVLHSIVFLDFPECIV